MNGSLPDCIMAVIVAFDRSLSFVARGLTAHETGRRGPIRARPRAYQDASGRAYEPVPVTH